MERRLPPVPFDHGGMLSALPPANTKKDGWPWTLEAKPASIEYRNNSVLKISIIVPSYNQCDFLEETLRSILLQNYPALELIVCDGGSTDGSVEVLQRYSPWLSYWHSKPDAGQAAAINAGFAMASGDICGWINSDDFYLLGAFSRVSRAAQRTGADVIYGDSITTYDNDTRYVYEAALLAWKRYLCFGGIIPSHATFWSRKVHEPLWEEMSCAVDFELWRRLLPGRKQHHIRHPLGVFRVQPDAKSSAELWQSRWESDRQKLRDRYGKSAEPSHWLHREFRIVQSIYRITVPVYTEKALLTMVRQPAQ